MNTSFNQYSVVQNTEKTIKMSKNNINKNKKYVDLLINNAIESILVYKSNRNKLNASTN